jgi:hypothetical protein
MKFLIIGVMACMASLAATVAGADESSDIFTGRVEGVYVMLERGVFRETYQPQHYSEVWAEVKTYQLGENRAKGAVLMIRTNPSVERGDIVSFRLADDSMIQIAPLPRETRIVAVAAKHDTAIALLFGSSEADTAF